MKSAIASCVLLCACGAATEPHGFGLRPRVDLPLIVAEGDSLTSGPDTWARQLTDASIVNVAVPGDRLKVMVDDAAEQVDSLYEPGAIAVLFGGTNDLKAFSVSSEWLLDKTQLWVAGRLAAGFEVAVLNMLPRGNLDDAQQATRSAFNAGLPAAVPGALVVDVCCLPGAPDMAPLWRGDGVHPSTEGHAWLLEQRIRPALERLARP